MKQTLLSCLCLWMGSSALVAWASDSVRTVDGQSYRKRTIKDAKGKTLQVVDFDDARIEGAAKAPDGFYLQSRNQGKFQSILELRKDFRKRMTTSVGETAP